ncbi:hypothetical protein [Phenylobacterium sp.]|jgi:hypothetical protein|uniref:hypothetical protein n=1 Tax=Phenylobacterium sp. TaxID=1871053 RepID=UPI002E3819DD|nr:hypothetical protein [Phenylobacterium sp.]HEX3367052.1 hypothetical protein [Phenylobacterium sp.]
MSEQVVEDLEDLEQPAANGELVHWMGRKPLTVGPTGLSVAAASGFILGVAGTLTVLALAGWLGPEREIAAPRRR